MSVNLSSGLTAPLNSALLHKVASSGDYNDLRNKPPSLASFANDIQSSPHSFDVGDNLTLSSGSVTCYLNPITLTTFGSTSSYTSVFGSNSFQTPRIVTGTLAAGTATVGSLSVTLGSVAQLYVASGSVSSLTAAAATISSLQAAAATVTSASVSSLLLGTETVSASSISALRAAVATITTGSVGTETVGASSVSSLQAAAATITAGSIGTVTVGAASVTALQAAAATVTGGSFTSLLVSTGTVGAASISALQAATATVTSGSIATLAVGTETVSTSSITSLRVGVGSVGSVTVGTETVSSWFCTVGSVGNLTCGTLTVQVSNTGSETQGAVIAGGGSFTTASVGLLTVQNLQGGFANIQSGTIGGLAVTSALIMAGTALNLHVNSADIDNCFTDVLSTPYATVSNLSAAVGSVDSLQANALLASMINAGNVGADNATFTVLSAGSATASTLSAGAAYAGTLNASRAVVTTLVGTTASLTGITAASGSITALTTGDFVTGTLTCRALKTPLQPGTGCLYQSGAYADAAGLTNTATWPTSAVGVGTYTGGAGSNGQYAFSGYIYTPYAVTVPFLLQAPQFVPTGAGLTLASYDWFAAPGYSAAANPKASAIRTTSTSQPALYNLGATATYGGNILTYADGSGPTPQTSANYQIFWNGYLFSPIQRTVYFGLQTYAGAGQNNAQPYVGCSIAGTAIPGWSPVFASGWGSYSAGNVANSNYFFSGGQYWWKVTLQPGFNAVTDIGFRARTSTGFATQNFALCWWADTTGTPTAAGANGASWQAVPASVLFTTNTTAYNNIDVWNASSINGVTLASAVQAVTGTTPATWVGNPQYFPMTVPLAAGANVFRIAFRLAGASGGAASFQMQWNNAGSGNVVVPSASLYPNVPAAIGNFFDGANFTLGSGTISSGPVRANGSVTATALGLPNASAFTGKVSELNNDAGYTSVTKVSQLTNDSGYTNVTNNNQLTNGNGYYANGDTITCYQLNLNSQAQGSITQGPSQVTVWSANDGHWYSSGKHFLFGADGSGYCPGGWKTSSDRRVKRDIEYLDPSDSYDLVKQLKPCSFVYKETGSPSVGYIAQELQTVIPTAVAGYYKQNHEDDEVTILSADYSQTGVVLASAMQQLQGLVETLTARVAKLEASAGSSTTA